jgi:hypothetical protein
MIKIVKQSEAGHSPGSRLTVIVALAKSIERITSDRAGSRISPRSPWTT